MQNPYKTQKHGKDDRYVLSKRNLSGITVGVLYRSETRNRIYLETIYNQQLSSWLHLNIASQTEEMEANNARRRSAD